MRGPTIAQKICQTFQARRRKEIAGLSSASVCGPGGGVRGGGATTLGGGGGARLVRGGCLPLLRAISTSYLPDTLAIMVAI